MIISHKHKFIFLHCRKAAGSSITVSLTRYLGPDDILLGPVDDCVAHGVYPPRRMILEALYHPNGKAALSHLYRGAIWKFVSTSNKAYFRKALGPAPTHAPARQVRAAFPDIWRDYRKFCVVRNPWTKTASDYFWRTKKLSHPPSFEEYVKALKSGDTLNGIIPQNHSNFDIYTIDGKIAVDDCVPFEELTSRLEAVLGGIGLNWDRWLPNAKKNRGNSRYGNDKLDYESIYDKNSSSIIYDIYRNEIETFRYKAPAQR